MLGYYCGQFPLVELNFTFYRRPTADMLARLAARTPDGFQFLVKLPRTLSHEESTEHLASFGQAAERLQSEGRLLGLLCQLPQARHLDSGRLHWLERLAAELGSYRLAVEFRHQSWAHPEVPSWLRERKLDLVAVDVPDLPSLYPRGLVQSGSRIYVRFHSQSAENWYRSDKERYDFNYDERSLAEWALAVGRAAAGTSTVLMLFNNCQRSQAAANARRMQELLQRFTPQVQVVQPFAERAPGAQQKLLFE
jgi:uncharacterized protein YecE (DUF72 family)